MIFWCDPAVHDKPVAGQISFTYSAKFQSQMSHISNNLDGGIGIEVELICKAIYRCERQGAIKPSNPAAAHGRQVAGLAVCQLHRPPASSQLLCHRERGPPLPGLLLQVFTPPLSLPKIYQPPPPPGVFYYRFSFLLSPCPRYTNTPPSSPPGVFYYSLHSSTHPAQDLPTPPPPGDV